jgi:hypothetical protein
MKKNEIACFVFLSLCILGIVFWFLSNISKQEKKPLKQVDRDNTMKQKKNQNVGKRSSRNIPKKSQSRPSFEKYKEAYKTSEDVLSKIPVERDHCINKQGPVKYSWIELIFLQRTDKGTYKPFNPNGISID